MLHRRQFFALAATAGATRHARSAPASSAAPWRLLQPLDPAPEQQEQVRDYAAGLQLALQVANKAGGIAGREVQVQALAVDATVAGVQALRQRLRSDSGVLGLVGCAGERLSLAVIDGLLQSDPGVMHVAPWLPDDRHDSAPQVINLFASRDDQVRHSLASLDAMGLRQIGLVYDSEATRSSVQAGLDATLARLSLRPPSWTASPQVGVEGLARQLPGDVPAVLAFAGGTLELARFVKTLAARRLQRYVVSLADADLGLLTQLGATQAMPLVLTQVVPNPRSASVPLVRHYRGLYARLYDDTPSPQGLAGYVAGRYLLRLLERVAAAPGRPLLADEVRRRPPLDVEGYLLNFTNGRPRGSSFVTQTMVTQDGRLIG
jgi:ABC-type branched-subunit amino acid transport system substrate-binding protein